MSTQDLSIRDLEEETKLLRRDPDEPGIYDALKLPISEIRVTGNLVLNNPVLQSNNGVAVWQIPIHGTDVLIQMKEVATGDSIFPAYDVTSANETHTLNIYINTEIEVPADTYRVVVIG